MTALHAPAAVPAVANRDVKRAHDRADVGQIFLVLRRVSRGLQLSATIRTAGGQRRGMSFIDMRGDGAVGRSAIRRTRFGAWPTAGRAAREWRRLPMHRPTRVIQVVFEAVDLLPQPLAFLTMAVSLAFQFGDQFFTRGRTPARLHALVMPRLEQKYKRKLPRSRRSDGAKRVTTR
jgi:hypothetical protein